jgi:hypothetical protein
LQLVRLVERITRNFEEKRLTGADFLDVAKAFDTVWMDGVLYKLTLLKVPSYTVHKMSSYLRGRKFEASIQTAKSSRRVMGAGVTQGGLISLVLFCLYVNDMPSPSHHFELVLYANDSALIATSRKPTLLVSYLESYLNELQRCSSEWRIAINVTKSTTISLALAGPLFIQPRLVTLFGEPIQWVDRTHYLGVTLDTRLNCSPHIRQVRKKTAHRLCILGPVLNRKSDLSVRNGAFYISSSLSP